MGERERTKWAAKETRVNRMTEKTQMKETSHSDGTASGPFFKLPANGGRGSGYLLHVWKMAC